MLSRSGVYCGSGVAAAHELAVLSSLGVVASIYVGSFTSVELGSRASSDDW